MSPCTGTVSAADPRAVATSQPLVNEFGCPRLMLRASRLPTIHAGDVATRSPRSRAPRNHADAVSRGPAPILSVRPSPSPRQLGGRHSFARSGRPVERSDPACHRSASAWKRSRWNRLYMYVYVLKLPKSSSRGSGEPAAPRRTAQENGPGELVCYRRLRPRDASTTPAR